LAEADLTGPQDRDVRNELAVELLIGYGRSNAVRRESSMALPRAAAKGVPNRGE
jgi:hypothetical protein